MRMMANPVSARSDICLLYALVPVQLTKADYSWPTLGPKLNELIKNVNAGRGFQLLKYVNYYHDVYATCCVCKLLQPSQLLLDVHVPACMVH